MRREGLELLFLTSKFWLLTSVVDPIGTRSSEAGPENGEAGRADDQAQTLHPPCAIAAAEFDPPCGDGEGEADQDREWPPADETEQHAAGATQGHREIA